MNDKKAIGIKNGIVVYASHDLLAQKGHREVLEQLGMEDMIRRYPVQTDLSGNVVMVEANSHEEAIDKYLSRSTNNSTPSASPSAPDAQTRPPTD